MNHSSGILRKMKIQTEVSYMKFGNGCWLLREGCECFSPQEVYFVKRDRKKVTLVCPTARIAKRGDTLGGINLTMEITSPMPEVLRVKTSHHLGIYKRGPEFELKVGCRKTYS